MTDIDELERKKEKLSALLRVFVIVAALLGLVLVGALISLLNQERPTMSKPSRDAGSFKNEVVQTRLFA